MLHYNSLRRYTLALLSTFNDINTYYLASDGVTELSSKIPIKFSSREKANLFDEHTTSALKSGNYNVLPRMSLVLTSVIKSDQRTTNKFTKHNIQDVDSDTLSFNYNAVPYEFMYELMVQCRGMNEASMIIEQIAPRFNPNYSIRINEIPGVDEATTIPVSLLDISIETEEYEEVSTNIVNLSFGLSLKGNLYPQLANMPKIKKLNMYTSIYDNNEYTRSSLQEWDVVNSVIEPLTHQTTVFNNTVVPVVNDIIGSFVLGESVLKADFVDKYNNISELIFVWQVTSGVATITTGLPEATITVNSGTTVTVQLQIIDVHGNTSNVFTKIL